MRLPAMYVTPDLGYDYQQEERGRKGEDNKSDGNKNKQQTKSLRPLLTEKQSKTKIIACYQRFFFDEIRRYVEMLRADLNEGCFSGGFQHFPKNSVFLVFFL